MSIFGAMRTATSGMAAQSSRLGTVSDNIANASTHGYKRAFTEFSTVVLESGGGAYVPGSVDTEIRYGISQQGGFDFTTSKTDLAIDGDGFFLVNDESGSTFLTRAGSFVKNSDGELINAAGFKLMGYELIDGNATVSANSTAGLSAINIATMTLQAQPSQDGIFAVNMPVTDTAVVAAGSLPSDNVAGADYTRATSLTVFDNVGTQRQLDIYFTRTALADSTVPVLDTWEVAVFDHSAATSGTGGPFPYTGGALTTASLAFDSLGNLDSASPQSLAIAVPNGATLNLDISGMKQLNADFQSINAVIDGNAASPVDHVEFGADGTLYSVYANGNRIASYRIPLATVASPDNLTPESGNIYTLSADSGNLQIGFPTTGQFGKIKTSALEKSTVDTASELTTMIESQFSFTANSKVFQTAGELMEVLVNLKR